MIFPCVLAAYLPMACLPMACLPMACTVRCLVDGIWETPITSDSLPEIYFPFEKPFLLSNLLLKSVILRSKEIMKIDIKVMK